MTDSVPFGGELLMRLSWGPRGEGLASIASRLRACCEVLGALPGPFDQRLELVDPDGARFGVLADLKDGDVVATLERGVARNEDESPLPQDGYSVRLETSPGSAMSGRVVGRFGATRERFSAGNWLTVSVAQSFSEQSMDTAFFAGRQGQQSLRELVAIWSPDRAGIFLAEAEDAFFDLDLPVELGLVTYLARPGVAPSDRLSIEADESGSWITLTGLEDVGGLNELVARIVDASEEVSASSTGHLQGGSRD